MDALPPSALQSHTAPHSAMPHTACIALGSNLGDRIRYLQAAVDALAATAAIRILALSAVYETEPVGSVPQGSYLNAALTVATALEPVALLRHGLQIELANGRVRNERFGPRTLDIDLLWHSAAESLDTAELILPHPRLHQRAFVLRPLADIAPQLAISGKSVRQWLADCPADGIARTGLQLLPPAGIP